MIISILFFYATYDSIAFYFFALFTFQWLLAQDSAIIRIDFALQMQVLHFRDELSSLCKK